MDYISFKTDQAKAEEIRDFYQAERVDDGSYLCFQAKRGTLSIHCYRNRKGIYTIVFSSPDDEAKNEASQFSSALTVKHVSENAMKNAANRKEYFQGWEDLSYQIGSDEVGVGDFFGPLVVSSSYVTPEDIPVLEKLGINDSKKMSDAYILSIGPQLKRRIRSYIVSVSANKLSELVQNGMNIHKIMAKCHNITHLGIIRKYALSKETIIYVDQFTPEDIYRRLVGYDIVTNPLYFRVRGESYFPSVASASVLSRYTFLTEWKKMENALGMSIPKGASGLVDKTYNILKKQYPREKLDPFVKRYFRNYRSN